MIKQNLSKIGLGILFIMFALLFTSNNTAAKTENSIDREFTSLSSTLCSRDEQTIWSCSTNKNKIVSVCASKELTNEKGYVQYRYGTKSNIELEFPKDRLQSLKAFRYARYTRPLVTRLTLKFENQGFTYVIHDDDESDEKMPVRDGLVDITNASGKQISTVTCKMPSQGSLMGLEDIVPRDEYEF